MKILQVVHFNPLTGYGGTEAYTRQLSQSLAAQHEVLLLCTTPGGEGLTTIERGCRDNVHFVAVHKEYLNFDKPFHERDRLVEHIFVQTLREFKPDVIHFQHLINLSLALPWIAHTRGFRTCFTLHDFWLLCPRNFLLTRDLRLCPGPRVSACRACLADRTGYYSLTSRGTAPVRFIKSMLKYLVNARKKALVSYSLAVWRPLLVKKVFAAVDRFVAPSRFLMETFLRAGLPRHKMIHCRHGIDTTLFQDVHTVPADRLRFAFIGSVRPHKGVDLLIDAFHRIPAPHELHIYGPIPHNMRSELSARIKDPRISIRGELTGGQKAEAFSEIDVLVLPSRCQENCPLVIAEAFAAKIPVIVAAVGGMAELVENGRTGVTFPPGDTAALAQCMLRFVADPKLKDRLAAAIPPQKTMAEHAEEMIALYHGLGAS